MLSIDELRTNPAQKNQLKVNKWFIPPKDTFDPKINFYFHIPHSVYSIRFDTNEIKQNGTDYLKSMARYIHKFFPNPLGLLPVVLRTQVPECVEIYGGYVMYYFELAKGQPGIMFGKPDNETIQDLDREYFKPREVV